MPTVMLTVGIAVALGAELAGATADLAGTAADLAGTAADLTSAWSLNPMTFNWRLSLNKVPTVAGYSFVQEFLRAVILCRHYPFMGMFYDALMTIKYTQLTHS
jgi:hypothetical protein